MSTVPHSGLMQRYHVRIGHSEMTISASDEQQARQLARRQLSSDHPRLWDKIYQIKDAQIQVESMSKIEE